ncbi:MAG: hypothetical protein JWM80_3870 [Cyanobacteria bacterium RYN_339]|nr:hypothetical protein [Cyanobacteria bacterium RYN_339]
MGAYVRPFPRVVRIEPAAACNLACRHCPTGTVDMKRGLMSEAVFDAALRALERHRDAVKVVVLYHGGEPLMNKAFPAMIRRIKALGIPFVKTVSNGMLLTETASRDLLASGLDALEISLDAQTEAQNDFVRRKSNYAQVVANIRRFVDLRAACDHPTPRLDLSSTQFLSPATLDQRSGPVSPPAHLLRDFGAELAAGTIGLKLHWAMRWPHMEVDEGEFDVFLDDQGEDLNTCDHVDSTVTIRAEGDVVACCYDLTSRLVLGNILETDLAEIWNGPGYLGLREGIATKSYPSPCDNCNTVRRNAYLVPRAPQLVGGLAED